MGQEPMAKSERNIGSYRQFHKYVKSMTSESMKKAYDQGYYQTMVGGKEVSDAFFDSKGLEPTRYTRLPIQLAHIRPGDRIIDIGCGRGEVVFQTAGSGATSIGIDYSPSAIKIALETRESHDEGMRSRTSFLCRNALDPGFEDYSFDKAFLLDVVEHVAGSELRAMFREINRLLTSRGVLIIHTTQNIWSRKMGYWLKAAVYRTFRGSHLTHPVIREYQEMKADPDYDEDKIFLHINEQSVFGLKVELALCGFRSAVWLGNTGNPWLNSDSPSGRILSALFQLTGMKYLFRSDIYAVAHPSKSMLRKP